jgi:adenylate cyclase
MLADRVAVRHDCAMDFAKAGLLEGLDGEERASRERLLERLHTEGFTLEQLRRAVAEERLALLLVERVLGGRHTAREVEQSTGLAADLALRIRRVAGLPGAGPDDRVFDDDDAAAAAATKQFLDAGFDERAVLEITRVLGEGMARGAATTSAAFAGAFMSPGSNEDEVALRFAALSEQLVPAMTPVLVALFKSHLRDSVQRGVLGREELRTGQIDDEQQVAVCFADLVGFTRLGGELELRELGGVAGTLAELAAAVTHPPVRLVKTIGDAAMFVCREPAPLVDTALSLLEDGHRADLPSLRAGVATGPALLRAGDYYGPSVNLASRVTGFARPDSVLCTQDVHDAASAAFDWSFAGKHRLKGIREPLALFRARRVQDQAAVRS